MFCNKCGNELRPNQEFCNKCGNHVKPYNSTNVGTNNYNVQIIVTAVLVLVVIVVIFICIAYTKKQTDYFFADIGYNSHTESDFTETEQTTNQPSQTKTTDQTTTSNKKGKYTTAIITDNVYTGISINNEDDAYELISEDSINQKGDDYPEEILQIEEELINDYSITAVNLKEMDVDFARELQNLIKTVYEEYPQAREYLTNLTLVNLGIEDSGVIAQFMPIFKFGMSDTSTTRPWVIKTQVQLNSSYFLNPRKIELTTSNGSKSGHFPPNSTRTSGVAHEIGHYLSFIALLNNYSMDSIVVVEDDELKTYYDIYSDFERGDFSKKMLEEAYTNYLADNSDVLQDDISFDDWRGQISGYALAKDESGDYIYDETIAEAFHDVYLNGENANIASKYIVEVLKKYIGG